MKANFKSIENAKEYAKTQEWIHLAKEEAVPFKYAIYKCNCGECYAEFFETKNKDIIPLTICEWCGLDEYDNK